MRIASSRRMRSHAVTMASARSPPSAPRSRLAIDAASFTLIHESRKEKFVTLDLNGYRLTALTSGATGIYSYGGYDNIVIRNGQISAAYRGMYMETSSSQAFNVLVERLVVDNFSNLGLYMKA